MAAGLPWARQQQQQQQLGQVVLLGQMVGRQWCCSMQA
jgi:hypothetical protein